MASSRGRAAASSSDPFQAAIWWGFIGFVGFAPVYFGGATPPAWAINCGLAGLLLLLHAAHLIATGGRWPAPFTWIAGPALLFGLAMAWAAVQTLNVVPVSWRNPLWAEAASVFQHPMEGAISVSPWDTRDAILITLPCAATFWLAYQFGRDAARARRLLLAVMVFTTLNAVYGIWEKLSGRDHVLWVAKGALTGSTSGTFINQNHFALYLCIGLACATPAFIERCLTGYRWQERVGVYRLIALILAGGAAASWFGPCLFALLLGIFLSSSRAGAALALLAIIMPLAFHAARLSSRAVLSTLAVAVVVLGAGFSWLFSVFGDATVGKVGSAGIAIDDRLRLFSHGVSMIADSPWLGFGYGTFEQSFRLYQQWDISWINTWNAMHNSYIEAAIGLGVPAAACLIGSVAWTAAFCFRGAFRRRRGYLSPIAAATAATVVGLQCLGDFGIQLQGIAITLAALLGNGCAQSWSSRQSLPAAVAPIRASGDTVLLASASR